ncbi:MAG: hypothetical protein JO130_03180 [Solirubrobacterales bacterium]|nr:hypothetical protein [Solirubrobacterales bacterium]
MVHGTSLSRTLALIRRTLALILGVGVCTGCGGSSGPPKTAPQAYVRAVCSAISPLERDVVSRSSALGGSTATDATQAKETLKGFLTAVAQDADHALARIQAAGTPDIKNGQRVSSAIVNTFAQLRDTMRTAVSKAGSLPTDSASSFNSAAHALTVSVKSSLSNIDASGLSDPDLENAAAKEPACQSLNS